jgi:3-hydroxybutyryl-CoA dehydrogenase
MAADRFIRRVGVIGAGTMGTGIAQALAQGRFDVRLFDHDRGALERSVGTIAGHLGRLVDKRTLSGEDAERALARISTMPSLAEACEADYIIEAVIEDQAVKTALFRELGAQAAPRVILASNTSAIPIARLAVASGRPDRVLGMHFMNPVPLMPLVELVRARETSDETMTVARQICERLGKTGVESADRPGFIANRVLMPMINEAIWALMEGVGTAEAIDAVMTLGMRHPMGPLALADLIGLDVCLAIMRVLEEGLDDEKYRACPLLAQKVAAGHLGRKTGQGFYSYTS